MIYRVLIVEDDPRVAQVNQAFVEAKPGFKVVGVAQGLGEAFEKVETLRPHLLLLDLYLPDGQGLELVARIKDPPTIAITAAQDAPTVVQALGEGVLDYLIKPFAPKRLHQALERFRVLMGLRARGQVGQAELDQLFRLGRPPKGLHAELLERVHRLVVEMGPLGVEEVAARLGLGRSTAWRYLEYLVREGALLAEERLGRVGRPARRYRAP